MTTEALLDRHIAHFASGDLEGMLAGYAEDAVFLSADGVLRGREALRPVLSGIIAEFSQPGVGFELLAKHVEGDYGYLAWKAETPANSYAMGSDTMVFADGKIVMQSAAIAATPKR